MACARSGPRRPTPIRNVILYLHGGGYAICSLDSHRHLAAEAGRAPAPGHWQSIIASPGTRIPAPVDDGLAAYRYLLESGHQPAASPLPATAPAEARRRRLLAIRDAGLPLPACACASPRGWTWRRWRFLHRPRRSRPNRDP